MVYWNSKGVFCYTKKKKRGGSKVTCFKPPNNNYSGFDGGVRVARKKTRRSSSLSLPMMPMPLMTPNPPHKKKRVKGKRRSNKILDDFLVGTIIKELVKKRNKKK